MTKTVMNNDSHSPFHIEFVTSVNLNEKYRRFSSYGSVSSLGSSMSQFTSSTCTTSFGSETTEDDNTWEEENYPSHLYKEKYLEDNINNTNGNESIVTKPYDQETIDERQDHNKYNKSYSTENEDDDTITYFEPQLGKVENYDQVDDQYLNFLSIQKEVKLSESKFNMDLIESYQQLKSINYKSNEMQLAMTNYKETIKMFEAHEDDLKTNSKEWESYVTTLCQLGILYNHCNKTKQALLLYEKAIEVLFKYKGDSCHPIYPEICYHMGLAYKEVGMNDDAYMFHFKQFIFEKENENGNVHKLHKLRNSNSLLDLKSDTEKVKIMNQICCLFLKKKEYREALHCCDELYKMYSGKVDASTEDITTTHMNMGDVFRAFHKMDDAIECYTKALDVKNTNNTNKKDWNQQSELLYNIGISYLEKKSIQNAVHYLQDFLTSLTNMDLTDSHHPSILLKKSNALTYLGNIQSQMSLYKVAIKYYQEALKIRLILHGENSKEAFEANCNLGTTYFHDKKFDKAQRIFTNLLSRGEKNETQGIDKALILYELGKVDMATENFKGALVNFNKSLKIRQNTLTDEDDSNILKTWHSIALAQCYVGNLQQAKSILLDIQQRYRSKIDDSHPLHAKIHLDVAKVFLYLNQIVEAEQHCLKAIKGFTTANFSNQHPYLLYARKIFHKVLARKEGVNNTLTKENEYCEIFLV